MTLHRQAPRRPARWYSEGTILEKRNGELWKAQSGFLDYWRWEFVGLNDDQDQDILNAANLRFDTTHTPYDNPQTRQERKTFPALRLAYLHGRLDQITFSERTEVNA